ncbi:MAG: hypothetical protein V3W41_11035 [Planctomycetota bacterium]
MPSTLSWSLAAILLAFAGSLRAQVIQVPAEYPTIQLAIDAAPSGAEIRLAPGTYVQDRLSIVGKSLRLVGTAGALETLLLPTTGQEAMAFDGAGVHHLELKGLHFFGSSGVGSALVVTDGQLTCSNCIFESNTSSLPGAAVSVRAIEAPVHAVFERSVFRFNFSGASAGAIYLQSSYEGPTLEVFLTSCIIHHNFATQGASAIGGIVDGPLVLAIQNTTLWENVVTVPGIGVATVYIFGDFGATGVLSGLNTICRDNQPGEFISDAGSLATVPFSIQNAHCNMDTIPAAGAGNIDVEPGFVNAALGDFSLLPESGCVDAGLWYFPVSDTDVDGEERIFGFGFDIGADEYHPFIRHEGSNEGLDAEALVYPFSAAFYPEVSGGDFLRFDAWGTHPPFDLDPIAIVVQTFVGAKPESPLGFPSAHINPDLADPPHVLIDIGFPNSYPSFPGDPVSLFREIPAGFAGHSFTVQAFSLASVALNGHFAASPAFEIKVF